MDILNNNPTITLSIEFKNNNTSNRSNYSHLGPSVPILVNYKCSLVLLKSWLQIKNMFHLFNEIKTRIE